MNLSWLVKKQYNTIKLILNVKLKKATYVVLKKFKIKQSINKIIKALPTFISWSVILFFVGLAVFLLFYVTIEALKCYNNGVFNVY
jgi:hypothetical protein